jgi:hypothetical protein
MKNIKTEIEKYLQDIPKAQHEIISKELYLDLNNIKKMHIWHDEKALDNFLRFYLKLYFKNVKTFMNIQNTEKQDYSWTMNLF